MITSAAPNQRGVIDALQDRFVRQGANAIASEQPIHEIWTNVLAKVPAVRGRRLSDDLSDIYDHAEKNLVGVPLAAVVDLVCLQLEFYDLLRERGIGFPHVMQYTIEHIDLWGVRLYERVQVTKPYRRTTGRTGVRKPKKPPVSYGWLQ